MTRKRGRLAREDGQAFIETLLMVWLLTLLFSAILQVFLAHNYAYQMANNAYYSLFKDKAYGTHNKPSMSFNGFPNWHKKPFRTVNPLQQAGGKVHDLSGGPAVSWAQDDRAAVPMMPFFREPIIERLQSINVTAPEVRLKVGTPIPGHNYLDHKYLRMAMGTEGGFSAFFEMIGSIVQIAGALGRDASSYTGGYSEDELEDLFGDYEGAEGDLNDQDPNAAQEAREQWDEAHGDYNHDGYNDHCESLNGNNHPSCKTGRPWE